MVSDPCLARLRIQNLVVENDPVRTFAGFLALWTEIGMGGWTPSKFRMLPIRFGSWIGAGMANSRERKLVRAKEDAGTWKEWTIAVRGQMQAVARRIGRTALCIAEGVRRRNMGRSVRKGIDAVRMTCAALGAVPIMAPASLMRREVAIARSEEIAGRNPIFGAIEMKCGETPLLVTTNRVSLLGGPRAIVSDLTGRSAVAQQPSVRRDLTIAVKISNRGVESLARRRQFLASIAIVGPLMAPRMCFNGRVASAERRSRDRSYIISPD